MKIFKLSAYNPSTKEMIQEEFNDYTELHTKKATLASKGFSVGSYCNTEYNAKPEQPKEMNYEDLRF